MNILVVDDEEGIREGTRSYLQLKGFRSRSAADVTQALALLNEDHFDLVVCDWRLGEELATPVVEAAQCICIVVSGFPQEVTGLSNEVHVLAKPLPLSELLSLIQELEVRMQPVSDESDDALSWEVGLPVDARDHIRLVLSLSGKASATGQITDDGNIITVRVPWSDDEDSLRLIEALGGDMRVLQRGAQRMLELRFHRDGCPDGFTAPIHPSGMWPACPEPVAIDFDLAEAITPVEFLDLIERCNAAQEQGRDVCFLNVPSHLSLFLDALGRTDELPKRRRVGPRLPEILSELWS